MALKDELEAVERLKNILGSLAEQDPDLLLDSIEGETNLFEIIDSILLSYQIAKSNIKANKITIDNIEKRNQSFETRMQNIKDTLFTILEQLDLDDYKKELKRPLATLSLRNIAATGVINNEALIPSEYWVTKEPVIDKRKLNEDLKNGIAVQGAKLSNGGKTISILGI